MQKLTDETLTRATSGDHAAFAEIVRAHQSMVFSLACYFLRRRDLAEELAQEVFLELYRSLTSIQSTDHLTHWLRRVTSHRCIDQARRGRLRPYVGLDDAPEMAVEAAPPDPMLAGMLHRYVASLPEIQRMIVILKYQEDLDPSDIAELLEMPVNTVKSHLQRSHAVLRRKLSRSVGEVSA